MIIEIVDYINYPYPDDVIHDPPVTFDFSIREIAPGKLDITLISAWGFIGYLDNALIPAKDLIRVEQLALSKYNENWTFSKRFL